MPRDRAVLRSYNDDGSMLSEDSLDLHEYWDGENPLIDDSSFRQERAIRKIRGELFDAKGKLFEEFENVYDEAGALVSSWARHDDGTETNFGP